MGHATCASSQAEGPGGGAVLPLPPGAIPVNGSLLDALDKAIAAVDEEEALAAQILADHAAFVASVRVIHQTIQVHRRRDISDLCLAERIASELEARTRGVS